RGTQRHSGDEHATAAARVLTAGGIAGDRAVADRRDRRVDHDPAAVAGYEDVDRTVDRDLAVEELWIQGEAEDAAALLCRVAHHVAGLDDRAAAEQADAAAPIPGRAVLHVALLDDRTAVVDEDAAAVGRCPAVLDRALADDRVGQVD